MKIKNENKSKYHKKIKNIPILALFFISAIILLSSRNNKNNIYISVEPSSFTELLDIAKRTLSQEDPYISSSIKPQDPLYPGIKAIQIGLPAADLLRPMAEQKNADAMFWLARRITGLEALYGGEAALYREAAELGNPYAAMKLDPRLNPSHECDPKLELTHFRCDEKWGEMALELLESRAQSGDIKAEYYYHKSKIQIENSVSSEDHTTLIDIATRGAKKNYYRPLFDLVEYYHLSKPKDYIFSKENLEATEILVKMMIKNNYIPAVRFARGKILFDSLSPEWKKTVREKYVKLGLHYPFTIEFFDIIYDKKTATENLSLIYRNLYILKEVYGIDYYQRVDEEVMLFEKDPIRLAAEEEARSIIKTIHFPIYIDEQNLP